MNLIYSAGFAAIIAVPLSVGLGILSAINEGKWIDKVANIVSLAFISVPASLSKKASRCAASRNR